MIHPIIPVLGDVPGSVSTLGYVISHVIDKGGGLPERRRNGGNTSEAVCREASNIIQGISDRNQITSVHGISKLKCVICAVGYRFYLPSRVVSSRDLSIFRV